MCDLILHFPFRGCRLIKEIPVIGRQAIAIILLLALVACADKFDYSKGAQLTGGNPEVGREKIVAHDCHSCHEIPGIPVNANRKGPDLKHWSRRSKIANNWPNTPENLEDYIRHPDRMMHGKGVKSEISMPSVNAEDAKNIAAYLYSIE
jgi:cytochrome c2